ncbi:hypothetical protein SAMN05443252_103214 [Bacillus sp. OV322]|uniref:YqgU-like beta propeller domain-containing protein n=1 Tax=Bacillus sp. OV322 TaxID=1882764 RepID=UPI0008F2CDBD|nr:hypothetical protein [Bacillus sp. OV322]SFC39673.1 hypothetical protein SAMN05443252_103214 [Bacillus sp. OV322]
MFQGSLEDDPPQDTKPAPNIPLQTGDLNAIAYGWLDSHTILYSSGKKGNQMQELHSWNMKTNKKRVFFQNEASISDVKISPSKSFVLVKLSSSKKKAIIEILDHTGKSVYSAAIPSTELTYEWNPYSDGVLFISGFNENWTYSSYAADVTRKKMDKVPFPQPFAQWSSKDELLYLDWDKKNPGQTAPLMKRNFTSGKTETVMLDIGYFKKWSKGLMTIAASSESPDKADYIFYNNKGKALSSMSMPLLKTFSDWVIPKMDVIGKTTELITFRPERGGDGSGADKHFSLVSFNWKTGKEEELLKHQSNEPLSCSPNGQWCLYGTQLENIVNMKTNKSYKLFSRKRG